MLAEGSSESEVAGLARESRMVPHGYEPQTSGRKGSIWVYDAFEREPERLLAAAVREAALRSFARIVLYPLHEETMRRMARSEPVSAFHRRGELLQDWLDAHQKEAFAGEIVLDRWEGKRKAYTPMEAALRHLAETYAAPHFMLVEAGTAERFASFEKPFEEWIKKLRLLILPGRRAPEHPRLLQHASRWELLTGHNTL